MSTGSKLASIRCDMHPPMSASMYCDNCKTFLCKICAEVRGGVRVCASCKKPCRQPAPEEWAELTAVRIKAREDAKLAKEAEGRIKDQLEKAKLDRDAKLKAEFAAKKAEWAQKEAQKQNQAKMASGAMTLPSRDEPTEPTYQPVVRASTASSDPLYALGERSHISNINKARNWILGVAILTMLINGVMYYIVTIGERFADTTHEAAIRAREERAKQPKKKGAKFIKVDPDENELREAGRADDTDASAVQDTFYDHAKSEIFWAKLVLFIYFAVGATFFVLYFQCVPYPKEATQIAFWLYLAVTVIDIGLMLTVGSLNLCGMALRGTILAALYNAMLSGQMLHDMRVRNGEVVA